MTIQQISIRETNYAIRWIVIYPVDSTIQRLSNQALDDEIVVDVVLDDGIGVDVVLDDEVVVEVDEMVANGVAVVGLDVGFDVVAVTPRKKKKCSIDLTIINLYVLIPHVWNFLAYINSKFSVSPILRK